MEGLQNEPREGFQGFPISRMIIPHGIPLMGFGQV
jgi:hypothetical protein